VKANDFLCRRNGIAFTNNNYARFILKDLNDTFGQTFNFSSEKIESEFNENLNNFKYLI
jgi:hypothetical protein